MTTPDDPRHHRFEALSDPAGVLPHCRRDRVSDLLSDADAPTLQRLIATCLGVETLLALALDLASSIVGASQPLAAPSSFLRSTS